MMVHGFGEDSSIWDNQVRHLKEQYRLLVPDLPGTGRSEMTDDMTMEGMADILYELLLDEGIKKCTLFGHSMGGYISLAFAEKHPDKLRAFGLIHSTAFADTEEKKNTRRKGIEFIGQYGAFEFFKTAVPNLFSEKTRTQNPDLVKHFIASLKDYKPEPQIRYYESMIGRPDRTQVLRDLKVPVLFIAGREDKAVPYQDSLLQCHLPEICYFHAFENSGHLSMLEEPEKLNKKLEKFLIRN